jgi:5'-methylthioadenosine phosphorylase
MIDTLIIGGSNAHTLKDAWGNAIEDFTMDTPYGKSHRIRTYEMGEKRFGLLFRHGTEGYDITAPDVNYRANIYAAKKLGVKRILSWTGPGAISRGYEIGDIVIPHDILDFTKKRPHTFFEGKGLGFIRMNPCFCPCIREQLKDILSETENTFHERGVYACTEGPRLETAAEIRFFASAGADMVGMTLVPEAFLARELEICYASLCYITNYAERDDIEYKEGELFEGTLPEEKKANVRKAVDLIPEVLKKAVLLKDDPLCICKKSMLRYKKAGKITENFEDWLR